MSPTLLWLLVFSVLCILLAWGTVILDRRVANMKPRYVIKLRNMMTGSYFTEIVHCDCADMAKKIAIARAGNRGVRAATVSIAFDEKA